MAKFTEKLGRDVKKTRNGPEIAKTQIRRNVLDALPNAHVFDAFAGHGAMHRAVWSRAKAYTGCDADFWQDDRHCFVADNRLVLRAIDLQPFTIFDLDAYGSPWEQAYIIAKRRPVQAGERVGLVITEGSGLKMKAGGISIAQSLLSGVTHHMPGMSRHADMILDRTLHGLCGLMGVSIEKRWQAKGKTGAAMRYVGLVLVGAAKP